MKDTVNHYIPPPNPLTSTEPRAFSNNLTMSFERTTRSVSLTSAGEALMPLLRQVVAGVDQIKIDAQALSGTVAGRLTVGMMEVPPESLEVALIAMFHARYPDVSVTLRRGGSDLLVEGTRDRKLDVAIVGTRVPSGTERLTFTHLFTESLIAVVPAGHPLTAGSSVSLTALAGLPFIDFPPGYGLRHETDRGFAGMPRRVAFEVTRVDEVIHFVRKILASRCCRNPLHANALTATRLLRYCPCAGRA